MVGQAPPIDRESLDAVAMELARDAAIPARERQSGLAALGNAGGLEQQRTFVCKDGSRIKAVVCVTPDHNAQGAIIGHLAVIQNEKPRNNSVAP